MAVAQDIQQQVFNILSRASNISFVTADQSSEDITLLTPGQRVNAVVLAQLANNRVQVGVGTERYSLNLPMAVRIGQTLEMTYVASGPRSTFAIARQAGDAPPVALSDASRLLSILVSSEEILDPKLRASLQSVGDLLRRSSGETAVLANLLDEALTYGSGQAGVAAKGTEEAVKGGLSPDQARLTAFETNAAQILRNIAQNSRFTVIEAATHPMAPLPLLPGEEVNATVLGTLSGGRAMVQIAGTTLELQLPQKVVPGEILRLTYLSGEPKPAFALGRSLPDPSPPQLSEAGRWLSVLEHSEGGISSQQQYVLDRLNLVLKSLPPNSPALSVISDEAQTYRVTGRPPAELSANVAVSAAASLPPLSGNGVLLSDDMGKLLQALIKGNRLALLESLNQQGPVSSLLPGQQIKGEVLAALGGGRFSVQVAEQVMEFIMPKGVGRGDLINLFFITEEPQRTFLMVRFGSQRESKVSDVSRWLSTLLGEAAARVSNQETIGILRTLLSEPTTDAQLLGQRLQQGLRESGLFYESHLARWFGGSYALEDILKEPQGRLSPRLPQAGMPQGAVAEDPVRADLRGGSVELMTAIKKAGDAMRHDGIADIRSLPMVNQQLTALQDGQMLFRGDLFPGQRLEWRVAEKGDGRNKSGTRERSWETRVTVTLPTLGPVTALLTLDGTAVAVAITAQNEDAAQILETGRARLIEQIEGAGLTPAGMSIGHATA